MASGGGSHSFSACLPLQCRRDKSLADVKHADQSGRKEKKRKFLLSCERSADGGEDTVLISLRESVAASSYTDHKQSLVVIATKLVT